MILIDLDTSQILSNFLTEFVEIFHSGHIVMKSHVYYRVDITFIRCFSSPHRLLCICQWVVATTVLIYISLTSNKTGALPTLRDEELDLTATPQLPILILNGYF